MAQPLSALSDNELYYTDMPVGEILRRTREHYGQSLQDIERNLRIRASQIEAIEKNQIEKLPGRVYAIGFVRSYSEYLGLDGNKMVHLFKIQSGSKNNSPELHFPATASESKIPQSWLVGASIAASVLIILGWWSLQSHDRSIVTEVPDPPSAFHAERDSEISEETIPAAEFVGPMPQPAGTEAAAVPPVEANPPATTTPPAAQTAASQEKGIILNITDNSWVEIRDSTGAIIVSRVLKEGDQYYVPDRPDLSMSLGNAGGVKLSVDGQALADLGEEGQVKRNISLDSKFLKKQYAKPVEKAPE